jgi:hypothetical protein
MTDKLGLNKERLWPEALSRHLLGGTEENHKNPNQLNGTVVLFKPN